MNDDWKARWEGAMDNGVRLQSELHAAREQIARLQAERDWKARCEAAEARVLKVECAAMQDHHSILALEVLRESAEKERDEARRQIDRLRESLEWAVDVIEGHLDPQKYFDKIRRQDARAILKETQP